MKRLKELREAYGMTQVELGKKLNVQKAAISKYEKGIVTPNGDLLSKLATIFNVTTDYLLGRDMTGAPALSAEQVALLKGFDSLNSDGQRDILGYLDFLKYKYARVESRNSVNQL